MMKRIHFEKTDSTNVEARRLFDSHSADELDGTVITAGSQSAGKGRVEGRRFFSPAGSGLYMSLILKVTPALIATDLITPAAGVAVCRTIEKLTGQKPQIKWVNDVFLNGKKVCGILTEGILSPEGSIGAVIVGIGVNVREPEGGFPEDLRDIVTAVNATLPSSAGNQITELTPDIFLDELLNQLSTAFEAARTEETVAAYQTHSLVVGKRVTVLAGNETYLADVLEVTKKCHLIVRPVEANGEAAFSETRELLSGEVSLRF